MPRKVIKEAQRINADDLFTSQQERDEAHLEKVMKIPIDEIESFPDHPFKVRDDEKFLALVESVKQQGVLLPVIVRVKDNKYQMISGHRRQKAAKMNGYQTIDCVIRDLNDEQAVIVMVDTNLHQRDSILPSEKAYAYQMKLDAVKRQGERTDLTSSQLAKKSAAEEVGKDFGDSKDTVYRFIHLTRLLPELLDYVDKRKIGLVPASELSELNQQEQNDLLLTIQTEDKFPSLEQAKYMRELSKLGKLDIDTIFNILTKKKEKNVSKITLKSDVLDKFFKQGTTQEKMEETIIMLLEQWCRKKQKERSR